MSKSNHSFNAEKILYVIKCIRNGGICNESLSKYTVVSVLGIFLRVRFTYFSSYIVRWK